MVFDHIVAAGATAEIEVIDGGLGGLDLLRFVAASRRLVFVDAVRGFGRAGVVLLDIHDAARNARTTYDHAAGLGYLLRVLPRVCEGPLPETFLVGIEGPPSPPMVAEAAGLSIGIASCAQTPALRRYALSPGVDR